MGEIYKGYSISTGWNDETTGFDFFVCDAEGTEVSRSGGSYFYEENALEAAKKAVDEKMGAGGDACRID